MPQAGLDCRLRGFNQLPMKEKATHSSMKTCFLRVRWLNDIQCYLANDHLKLCPNIVLRSALRPIELQMSRGAQTMNASIYSSQGEEQQCQMNKSEVPLVETPELVCYDSCQ